MEIRIALSGAHRSIAVLSRRCGWQFFGGSCLATAVFYGKSANPLDFVGEEGGVYSRTSENTLRIL